MERWHKTAGSKDEQEQKKLEDGEDHVLDQSWLPGKGS
jgi:hypothetical protein